MDIPIDYSFACGFERAYKGDFGAWQDALRSKLLEVLRFDRTPKGSLRIVETSVRQNQGLEERRHLVEVPPWAPQPIYEIEPQGRINGVTVLAFHGHGSPDHFSRTGLYYYVHEFARRGYRVIMPILFGVMEREARGMPYASELDAKAVCASWSIEADALGTSLIGARLFDASLAYRFARELAGVDGERIAGAGLSMGAQVALYLAAVEPGVRCTVCAGFFSSFRSLLLEMRNCQCYSIVGWPQLFDMPDIAGCVAPRPLQIQKGTEDGALDPADVDRAFLKLRQIYEASGAGRNVDYVTYPGGHILNVDKAEEWFRRHLRHDS